MNADTLLDNFEILTEAPGGINQLRSLILDLAIRGKLVKQLDTDGDARNLIHEIEKNRGLSFSAPQAVGFQIPSNWSTAKLGEVFYLEMGQSPDSDSYNQSARGLPFYQGKTDFGRFTPVPRFWCDKPAKRAFAGDVLLSVRAPVGPTNFVEEESCIGRGLAAIRPLCGMSTKFVLWWLRAHESKIANMGTGTTFIAVSKKSLFPLSIPVPPLAEQKRIVAKVDELMALCDQLEQAKNQRDEIRAATRKSAVDAISTAATPEELETAWKRINNNWDAIADTPESVSSLRSLVLDLAVRGMFSDSDSSSWRSSTLGEEVQIIRGITFPSSAKSRTPAKGLVPCLRTANIQDEVDWDDLLYVSEEYIRNDSQLVRVGDLLISMANSRELVGKVALVRKCDFKCTLGGFIAAIRCGTGIEPKFLMTALRVPSARDKLIDSSTQTTNIANISLGRLRPFELNLPPLEEQKRIVKKADELMALCDQLESELKSRSEVAEKFARSVVSAS